MSDVDWKARAEAAEKERDENEGVIRVWRRRTEEAEATCERLRKVEAELTGQLEAAEAELADLRDLFRLDEEQHVNHIKELTKAHEARITKYADELARQRTRAEAAEKERDAHLEASADYLVELTDVKAELARLREPVTEGEVGDMVKRLLMVAVIIKGEKAQVATDAADLLTRLAGQLAEAQSRYDGVYAQWGLAAKLCDEHRDRATTAEERLREAVEVMQNAHEVMHRLTAIIPGNDKALVETTDAMAAARALLSKLEPAPEPVREDTYPDRVSMEPWPYSGHAPGREKTDADQ